MNTDTRPEGFEERLLQSILDDFDTLTEPRSSRPRLPRPALPRLAWAGGLVAAAAMAILAVALSGGGSGGGVHGGPAASLAPGGAPSQAAPSAGTPEFVNADYVVKKVKAATSGGAGDPIEFVSSHAPDSETGAPTWTRSWSHPGSATSRIEVLDAAGNPVTASLVTTGKAADESVLIDYVDRTWAPLVSPNDPDESGPAPARAAAAAAGPEAEFHAALAEGTVRLAGHDTIDGRAAIELESTPAAFGEGTMRLWVDASTYLPIREVSTPPGASPTDPQSIRNDYRWLPANAESLAVLDPQTAVPNGFHEVSLAEEDHLEAAAEGR
jgi:hypothetical protein